MFGEAQRGNALILMLNLSMSRPKFTRTGSVPDGAVMDLFHREHSVWDQGALSTL